MFQKSLEKALSRSAHYPGLKEVMDYAVLPAGKLFRPKLVEAITLDLKQKINQDAIYLACAIELHHAYTLVHDDLPAMDNDLIRRGKPSTHAQFGEWKAILAGDSLLIASFEELMRISHSDIRSLHKLMSWSTGGRGLIKGQFLDLEADGKLNLNQIVRIHELKTARLIQVATLGSYLLGSSQKTLKGLIEYMRLGREIGVTFQLIDDLTELTDKNVSDHEKMINPFIISVKDALNSLRVSHGRLKKITGSNQLKHLEVMLDDYFKNSQTLLLNGLENIEKNIKESDLHSDLKKWITTFA
jgi:geranylgeranyl pyrophosphate synthase